MRGFFAYRFDGDVADLKVEEGDGAGFVVMSIEELELELKGQPEKYAMILTDQVGKDLIQKIKHILSD